MSSWHRAINCGSKAVEVQLGVGRSDGFGLEILSLEGLVGHSSGMVWCLLVLGVVVVVRAVQQRTWEKVKICNLHRTEKNKPQNKENHQSQVV